MARDAKTFRVIYAVDCGAICTSNVELDVKHVVAYTVNERQFFRAIFAHYKNRFLFLQFVFFDAKKE